MRVYEGAILTVDQDDSVRRFLVEGVGCILFMGGELPKRYESCDRVVLGSRAFRGQALAFCQLRYIQCGIERDGRLIKYGNC